jgi:hypothetical protein
MHHALWLDGDFSAPALISRPVNRIANITPRRIIAPVVDLLLLIAGMAASAQIKKVSPVKNPHLMNGVQTVIGVGGSLMTKNRFVKMPLLGLALQSAIAETKILIPKLPLSGDDEVMYLPAGDDVEQIEYFGEDTDVRGELVELPVEMTGADDRFAGDGEEIEYSGEGGEGGEGGE